MAKRVPIKAPVLQEWPKDVLCLDGVVRAYASAKDWRIDARKREKEKSDGADATYESRRPEG